MKYDELVKRLREFADVINRANAKQNANENIVAEAADAIEKLLQKTQQLPRWIPVEERLPENWTSVIVHRKDGGIFMWEYFDTSPTDECWIDDGMNVYSFYDVTHWMRLPEPPKEV